MNTKESTQEKEWEGDLEAFDMLSEPGDDINNGPIYELGRVVSKTSDMVTMPILTEGLRWQCVRNQSKGHLARWKVVTVEEAI